MDKKIHIGQMIKDHIEGNVIKRTRVSKLMNTPNTAIYSYEKRDYIHCRTLMRICHATNHNFFMDIANSLPATFTHNPNLVSEKDRLIANQAKEIDRLTLENNLMKELIKGKN